MMKFKRRVNFWVTDLGWPDVSFGIHLCFDGRVDVHFFKWMFSIGNVPLYEDRLGSIIAVSNSWHKTRKGSIRAGNP